MSMIL